MAHRINRAIEALSEDRAIYYTGIHSGHVLTLEQGRADGRGAGCQAGLKPNARRNLFLT
jgi:hypothetical protein